MSDLELMRRLDEMRVNGRDIYEVANQLGGYVGPDTEKLLADFLIREATAASDLADEIVLLTRELAEAQKDRDYWKVEAEGERAKVAFRDKKAVEKTKRLVQATKIISSYVERDENDGVTTGGDWGRLDAAKEFLAKLKEKP